MAEKIDETEQKVVNEDFPLALPKGTILAGQYVIDDVLGQGGFGITYVATDHKTNEKVAVKEFFPDSLAYREMTTVTSYPGERTENYEYGRENFLQEAKTLAEFIGCENIVRIYSYFEENNTAYFVMEYIDGVSFDHYLKEKGGKIDFDEASKILVPVMEALAIVHSKGIVHRDVTPDNIYITNDGKVKLLDFGAARYSLGDKSKSLDVILKHGFAPKEQYTRHGKQGPFTDIYSLGATFYFAITGRRPPDSIDRIEEDELIPPSSLGAKLTSYQEDAILHALEVNPQSRFQSMLDFRNVLLNENVPASAQPAFNQQFFNAPPANQGISAQQIPYTVQQSYPQGQVPYTVQQPYPQNQVPYTVQQSYPQNQVPYTTQQPYPQQQIPYTVQQPYPPQQAPAQENQGESVSKQLSESAKQLGSVMAQIGGGVAKQLGSTAKHIGESTAKRLSSAAQQLNTAAQQASEKAAENKAKKAAEAEAKRLAQEEAEKKAVEEAEAAEASRERPLFRDTPSDDDPIPETEEPKKSLSKKIIIYALIGIVLILAAFFISYSIENSGGSSAEVGDPTLINYETFSNIQNGGIETILLDGTYYYVSCDGHSVINGINGDELLSSRNKYYSNLMVDYDRNGMYYVENGRIGFYDFNENKGGLIKELKKFKGDDLQFYLAEDYYFIYADGKLHRVSKETNKSEESISVDPFKFAICDQYLYCIGKESGKGSVIYQKNLTNFDGYNSYRKFNNPDEFVYESLTSDGENLYAFYKYLNDNFGGIAIYGNYGNDCIFEDIVDSNNLIGSNNYTIEGFNAYNYCFSLIMRSNKGKEGAGFYKCYYKSGVATISGNAKLISTSNSKTYLSGYDSSVAFDFYNKDDNDKLYTRTIE